MSVRDKIDQEALETAIKFYDIDHELSHSQRENLAQFYRKLYVAQSIFIYMGFFPGISIPFIRKYQKTKSFKGTSLFWSTFFGFAGMMSVPQILTPVYYDSKLRELKDLKGTESKEVKIATILPPIFAIKWNAYYRLTSEDESKILTDPREKLKEAEAGQGRQRQPGLLSSGDLFGIKQGTTYGGVPRPANQNQNQNSGPGQGQSHTWEEIRRHETPQYQYSNTKNSNSYDPNGDDILDVDLGNGGNGDDRSAQYNNNNYNRSSSRSSWDRVRKGSISEGGNLISRPQAQIPSPNHPHNKTEQEEFEELLERERNATD